MAIKPISRLENFLARIGGDTTVQPIEPLSRFEKFLDQIAGNVARIPDNLYFEDIKGRQVICKQTDEEIYRVLSSEKTPECAIFFETGIGVRATKNKLKLPNVSLKIMPPEGGLTTYVLQADGFLPTTDESQTPCWLRYFLTLNCEKDDDGTIETQIQLDKSQFLYPYDGE